MTAYHLFFHQYLQVSRSLVKRINEALAPYDMYHSQWRIVYYLKNIGPATLVEIGAYFHVEKPTVTRTVNRLEKSGLIEQIPGRDKREKRIQLSEKGNGVYEECRAAVDGLEEKWMKDLSPEELEIAEKVLGHFQKIL